MQQYGYSPKEQSVWTSCSWDKITLSRLSSPLLLVLCPPFTCPHSLSFPALSALPVLYSCAYHSPIHSINLCLSLPALRSFGPCSYVSVTCSLISWAQVIHEVRCYIQYLGDPIACLVVKPIGSHGKLKQQVTIPQEHTQRISHVSSVCTSKSSTGI